MPFRSLLLAAGLSALLAGCGSDDSALVPQDDADRLSALVAEAGNASNERECDIAQQAVREAEQQLSALPRKTDRKLKANLKEWLEHLDEQIADECKAQEEKTPEPTASPDETEEPEPEPTATTEPTETPTETATPTASPEPTATTDPGTGGEEGLPEEPPGSGGVSPGEPR